MPSRLRRLYALMAPGRFLRLLVKLGGSRMMRSNCSLLACMVSRVSKASSATRL